MLFNIVKKIYNKGIILLIRSLPVVLPAFLILHTNATASSINGQPTPPESIKKYRKF